MVNREPRAAAHAQPARDESAKLLARLCTAPVPQIVMGIVFAAILPWAVYRAVGDHACDIADFVDGGTYVLQYGCRHPCTALNRYLPSLDVACIALTFLPLSVVATLYYIFNVVSWYGLLSTVQNRLLGDVAESERSRATMAAALLLLVIAIDGFLLGAFHVLMLWLMIAGLSDASRDRPLRGGTLLGLAIWLKLLPIAGVGYLLIKRKWSAAIVAVAFAVTLDIVLSLAAFGGQGTIDEHRKWAVDGAAGSFDRLMHDATLNEDRITNESITVVLRRFLTERAGFTKMAFADLSPQALSFVTGAVLTALGAAILFSLRRPASALSPADWGREIALVALCTVWFSPVVWSYHFTAAVPAMAVVMARRDAEWRKQLVALMWIIGMALFTWPLARAAGHMLWASFVVGAALVWTTATVAAADAAGDPARA